MQVTREITIHACLRHAHIIDFYASFEDADNVYLVQEFAYGAPATRAPAVLCPAAAHRAVPLSRWRPVRGVEALRRALQGQKRGAGRRAALPSGAEILPPEGGTSFCSCSPAAASCQLPAGFRG